MPTVTCECGGKVSTQAAQCPHCGKPGPFKPPEPKPERSLWLDALAAIVLACVALALLVWWMN